MKCGRTIGKKCFYARLRREENSSGVWGSLLVDRERTVLDLKSLGLNVEGNTCVERIFQRRDVRGKNVELK